MARPAPRVPLPEAPATRVPSGSHSLVLRVVILTGLVAFAAFLLAERGLLETALGADRSYLSYVILLIYAGASAHWLVLAYRLSDERDRLTQVERGLEQAQPVPLALGERGVRFRAQEWRTGYLAQYLRARLARSTAPSGEDSDPLLSALADLIANRHAAGHFISDTLLKLGLLGTIVGFILMLLPVSELRDFEPALAQQLLREMSGGMAVALYSTLTGLVTSTLLKLQYQVLDTSAQDFVTRLALLTDLGRAVPETGGERAS